MAITIKNNDYLERWEVTHGEGYNSTFKNFASEEEAITYAEEIKETGEDIIFLTDEYLESLKELGPNDLIELGVEPVRADSLTDMGMEIIETDGAYVYYAGLYSEPTSVARWVTDVNSQPFDYTDGVFTG